MGKASNGSHPPAGRAAARLRLLRRLHAWVGLGGAAFGLLFGATGFLLNHRSVLKVEAGRIVEQRVPVELEEVPPSPEGLARILATRLGVPAGRVRWEVRPARAGRLGDASVHVADQWVVTFPGHAHFASAAYTPGNRTLILEQREASPIQALKRLHKADGGQVGWILLSDAFAGSLIFLTLSGLLLWSRLAGPKLLAVGLATGGLLLAVLVASHAW